MSSKCLRRLGIGLNLVCCAVLFATIATPLVSAQTNGPIGLGETRAAAERGDPAAQYLLGRAHVLGEYVEPDPVQATFWMKKAAEQGYAEAQYAMGKGLSGSNDADRQAEAERWYRRAADQGHAESQYELALLFLQGRRGAAGPSNAREAIDLLTASARHGVPEAQLTLGSIGFMKGDGSADSAAWIAESAGWIMRAAEQGLPDAQLILSTLFEAGKGLPQDFVQAHMWANLAASKGAKNLMVGSAVDLRDKIAKKMTPSQLERAQELASRWKPQRRSTRE